MGKNKKRGLRGMSLSEEMNHQILQQVLREKIVGKMWNCALH